MKVIFCILGFLVLMFGMCVFLMFIAVAEADEQIEELRKEEMTYDRGIQKMDEGTDSISDAK